MLVKRVEKAEEEMEEILPPAEPVPAEVPMEEPEPEAEPEPEPVEASGPVRSQIDLLKVITSAFDNVVKEDGLAFLPQLSKEVKHIDPQIDFKSQGKAGLREFLEEFNDIFTLHKKGRNIYMSKRKGKRPAQHISELVR